MHFRLTESQRPAAAPGVGDTKSRVVISDFYLRHALSIIQDNTAGTSKKRKPEREHRVRSGGPHFLYFDPAQAF